MLGLILAVLCIAISIAAPQFYSGANIIAILRQCALVLIVACRHDDAAHHRRGRSLGRRVARLLSASSAWTSLNKTHSVLPRHAAGILFAGAVGLFNGLVVTRLKVNSLIATIGTMMILQGSVFLYSREAVQNHHQLPSFTEIGAGYIGPVPIPVIIAAVIFVVCLRRRSAAPRSAATSTRSAPTRGRRGSPACGRSG